MPSLSDFPKLTSTISKAICHDYREFKRDNEGGPIKKPDSKDNNAWIKKMEDIEEAIKAVNENLSYKTDNIDTTKIKKFLFDVDWTLKNARIKELSKMSFDKKLSYYFRKGSTVRLSKDTSKSNLKALNMSEDLNLEDSNYSLFINLCFEHLSYMIDDNSMSDGYDLYIKQYRNNSYDPWWRDDNIRKSLNVGYIPVYRQRYTNIVSVYLC